MPEAAEELTLAAGEKLVHVALVRDVEDKLVAGRFENAVEGKREFHDAEVGAHVAALAGGDGDDFIADFLGELRELVGSEGLDVLRAAKSRQESGERRAGGGRSGGGIVHRKVGGQREVGRRLRIEDKG